MTADTILGGKDLLAERVDHQTASNKTVFDVYAGLIVSGYDLANPDRAGAIRDTLMAENWNRRTLQYFGFARLQDGRLNPYWPRASILTSVGLLLSQSLPASPLASIRAHLAAMSNVSPADVDEVMVHWVADLPSRAELIRSAPVYAKAWELYQQVIQRELDEQSLPYQQEIRGAQKRLRQLLPTPDSPPPQMITIVNPLQADPLADVVSVHDRVYVITSHLRSDSYIHELIHVLLDPWLRRWQTRISHSAELLDLVYEPMKHIGYAWDHSAASWVNVFSETLVRLLTIIVTDDEGSIRPSQIDALAQQGFTYARPISETIAALNHRRTVSDAWLESCLVACSKWKRQADL